MTESTSRPRHMQFGRATGHNSLGWTKKLDPRFGRGLTVCSKPSSRASRVRLGFGDVLADLLLDSFTAVDLGCGPGSISQRLLARLPRAQAIAVDMDPVMLAIGKGALGTADGRLRWVEADVAVDDWASMLGDQPVDALLSSTALHWLEPEALARLYRSLGQLLPLGGVLLNADHLPYGADTPALARLGDQALDRQWSDEAFARRGIETAEQWWASLRQEAAFTELLDQQQRCFADKQRPASAPTFVDHVAALHDAGFCEVSTIWQRLTDRVLLAVR